MKRARAWLHLTITCAALAGCGDDSAMMNNTPPAGDMAISCPAGETLCAAGCQNLKRDPDNCGKCGTVCANGLACDNGVCSVTCGGGATNCDGQCKDLTSDPANCGGCKKACAQGISCVKSNCAAVCMNGLTDCSGVCTNLTSDNKHCGDCNTACPGDLACSDGKCGCSMGKTSRGGNTCVDTTNDPAHCGKCGNACAKGLVCAMGQCARECTPLTLCVNTCANLDSDNQNCGGCGKVCANGTSCVAGACVCPPQQTPCGSCTNLNIDPANCGKCGTVCPPPATFCEAGKCVNGCTPSGNRMVFTMFSSTAMNGCFKGNPCQGDSYLFDMSHNANFQAFGELVTCGAAQYTCISNVGINTFDGNPTICQGKWNVLCDQLIVGSINTLGTFCAGSAMANNCRVAFAPRYCKVITLTAVADGDNTLGCCQGKQPDSIVSAISAW